MQEGPVSVGAGRAYSAWEVSRWGDDPTIEEIGLARRRPLSAAEELMLAVLERAVKDMAEQQVAKDTADAYWYMQSRDRHWPLSFERVCEYFGFSADAIRARLSPLVPHRTLTDYPNPAVLRERIKQFLNESFGAQSLMSIHRAIRGGVQHHTEAVLREMRVNGEVTQEGWGHYRLVHPC